ncbi:hypothetical protein PanWU01x14_056550 [Parasponia andersonii]|uniref:Retrovirus-related Pol polyprotein from transposon TNT 1-94 n=1 Tax=Parasponia andersonii TaxID=3476 RepID=A0A2P5DKE9_PARAD|nr:hypothetical protein PanWU01x14_056550 [Parasponia andersonii]
MGYTDKVVSGQVIIQQNFFEENAYALRMAESTTVTDHINTLNTLFLQLTTIEYKIEDNERAQILLQNLFDLYDQLIINVTSNVITLVFNNLTATVLEKKNRHKNKEDISASS